MRADHTNFRIVCAGDTADIYLYDIIGADMFGGISAKDFADQMIQAKNARTINLRINSPGGDVFDGMAMYTLLKSSKATINVYVDALAASIASVIAMAGDTIEMAGPAMMMIHDPWGAMQGTAEDMRKQADLLDMVKGQIIDVYRKRTGMASDEIAALMAGEKWMTAWEATDMNFATRIGPDQAIAACIDRERFTHYKKIPLELFASQPKTKEQECREQIDAARKLGRKFHAA